MAALIQRIVQSPVLSRTVPFLIFVALTAMQGTLGESSRYWIYLLKTLIGAGFVWLLWRHIAEMRWGFSLQALLAGVAVFGIWVGLDGLYPSADALMRKVGLGGGAAHPSVLWNPHQHFGTGSLLAWFFVAVRLLGSTLVVPLLEEVFYRSFAYRYLSRSDFLALPLTQFLPGPFLIVALVFGFAHFEWLPGILCGLIYQGLTLRRGCLGEAITAHAITNALLAGWVVWKGAWHFW